MRAAGWSVGLALAMACAQPRDFEAASADSQSAYDYPGCASGQLICAQDVTLLCAIHALQTQYGACQVDAECTLVTLPRSCYATGDCPPLAVAAEHEITFLREAGLELEAYCDSPGCQGPTSCSLDPETVRAACVEGFCTTALPEEP